MPNENGFDFLKSIHKRNYSVIFITAYNKFFINTIKEFNRLYFKTDKFYRVEKL